MAFIVQFFKKNNDKKLLNISIDDINNDIDIDTLLIKARQQVNKDNQIVPTIDEKLWITHSNHGNQLLANQVANLLNDNDDYIVRIINTTTQHKFTLAKLPKIKF